MTQAEAAAGHPLLLRRMRSASWNVRATVIVCVVLICGSFAATAAIQMQRDRVHALSQAADFTRQRAAEIAADLGATLDRYAAFAAARANGENSANPGPALTSVAVFDAKGQPVSGMSDADARPLAGSVLAEIRRGHTAFIDADGHTLLLLSAAGSRFVMTGIDPAALLSPAGMRDTLVAFTSGRLLARGGDWNHAADAAPLADDAPGPVSRIVEQPGGARLVSLQRIAGWPLVAGASVPVAGTLDAWYGNFPLYLFFILGPAIAGAALAVLFVGVFERHAKAIASIRTLRALRPGETRLLVRLAEAERRAAEAERARNRFVAQVGHELRTPLNAIIGFAEIIEGGVFGTAGHPKYIEYSSDIGAAARELHSKIGAVLEYAALETSDEPAPPAARGADAASVVRIQVEQRAALARTRGLKLIVSIPEEVPVRADGHVLARIVTHLLDNALAYTPRGGTVRVEVRSSARGTVISVRDTGPGFTKSERERAGQPFQRFPRVGSAGGMGVGLAIAMGLARRLGGTLSLSSPPGEGTLAELRLAAATSQAS